MSMMIIILILISFCSFYRSIIIQRIGIWGSLVLVIYWKYRVEVEKGWVFGIQKGGGGLRFLILM